MKLDALPDHQAFRRLNVADRNLLMRSAEIWEAPQGSILYYPGDAGEDLLLVLEGRLDTGNSVSRRWFPGDFWGEDRLVQPAPVHHEIRAGEDSRWLRWSRTTFLHLTSVSRRLRRDITPIRNKNGHLISGLNVELPVIGTSHCRIRMSLKPIGINLIPTSVFATVLALSGMQSQTVPKLLFLAVPAVYILWMLFFLARRCFSEYRIEADAMRSKSIDWSQFNIESRYVPMDQVQGVQVVCNGIVRRLFHFGTIIVKTSALEGQFILHDVSSPHDLANTIRALKNSESTRTEGREQESVRRVLEEAGMGPPAPTIVQFGQAGNNAHFQPTDCTFRKSSFVLIGRLTLPFLIVLIPLFISFFIPAVLPFSWSIILAIIPGIWALYRFEDWRNDSFSIRSGYVMDLYRKPLGIKETRQQVELTAVQNIRTEQNGIWAFLFRYGDVILVTTGGASDIIFSNVSRPWKVQEILFMYREAEVFRREQAAQRQRRDELTSFASVMNQIQSKV